MNSHRPGALPPPQRRLNAAFRGALFWMPLSSFVGGLCLLYALLQGRGLARKRELLARQSFAPLPGRRLFLAFVLLSLLPLLWVSDPLAHFGGLVAHYLAPAILVRWFYRQLQRAAIQQAQALKALLWGVALVAWIGACNALLGFQMKLYFLRLPVYDRSALINLILPLHPDGRAQSFAMHPNILGAVLLLSLPLWLLPLNHLRLRAQGLLLSGLGLSLLTLGLSFSRAAWLAALPLLFLSGRWLLSASWRLSLGALALVLGAVPALLMGWGPRLWSYALSIFDPQFGSNYVRLLLWQSAMEMIGDRPFWGVGQLHFEQFYPQYQRYAETLGHVHNWYLQVALESGVPLALLFFVALFRLWGGPQALSREGKAAWLMVLGLLLISCVDIALLDWRVAWLGALALGYVAHDRETQAQQRALKRRFHPAQFESGPEHISDSSGAVSGRAQLKSRDNNG